MSKIPFPLFALALLFVSCPGANALSLKLIGRGTIPREYPFDGTKVGGLSGISYDSATGKFWAVSDDSASKGGPPRIYQIAIDISGGSDLVPKVEKVVVLSDENKKPFATADAEGIAATGQGAVWVVSEGRAGKDAPPWIRLFSLQDGRTLRSLPVPDVYLPKNASGININIGDAGQTSGVVPNRSLESCALSPDLKAIYTANETSLMQEKSVGEGSSGAGMFNETQIRISKINSKTGQCLGEKLYLADAGSFFGSVSELLALDGEGNLLVLERRMIRVEEGTGSVGVRIYAVNFNEDAATDLREIKSVMGSMVVSLTKIMIYDSRQEDFSRMDNLEGMTLVPLPNGKSGLVTVSDDNFNKVQETQILLYEIIH